MTAKSYDRSAILRAAWSRAKFIAAMACEPVRQFIGAAMRNVWALAKGVVPPAEPEMMAQPAQQQQACAAPADSIDDIKVRISDLASADKPDRAAIARLVAQLPGVESCQPEAGCVGNRLVIKATGTKCGSLDRPYGMPFIMDALAIKAPPRVNEALDLAIEEAKAAKVRRAELVARDGFDRAVDRTIVDGPFTATVEPVGYGEISVIVTAALRNGSSQRLGRVIMCPLETRGEVLSAAIYRLGYGDLGPDMDADDGSLLWSRERAILNYSLAR